MVDGAVLHLLDSSKSHIDFAIHIRTYSLETNSRTGLDCSDLGLSSGVLEIELVAAELRRGHIRDLKASWSDRMVNVERWSYSPEHCCSGSRSRECRTSPEIILL